MTFLSTEIRVPVQQHIAIVIPSLEGGGAERVAVTLASEFCQRGIRVDLVAGRAHGAYRSSVPSAVRVIELGQRRFSGNLVGLVRYFWKEKPTIVLSHMTHTNLVCGFAKLVSGSSANFFPVEHTPLPYFLKDFQSGVLRKFTLLTLRALYHPAKKVITVSDGIRSEFLQLMPSMEDRTVRIYNPIIDRREEPAEDLRATHPWLDQGVPFILAVGRLSREKNFSFLIDSVATLLEQGDLRLIILGEGDERPVLEQKLRDRNLEKHVSLPGFVSNVRTFMERAEVLTLCSLFEGLPTVIVEALACGTQVVATDCVTGPKEILDGTRFGELVPEDDSERFCEALQRALEKPRRKELLVRRADDFGVERSVNIYLEVFGMVGGTKRSEEY